MLKILAEGMDFQFVIFTDSPDHKIGTVIEI
jgi:hypothetical protein